VIFTPTSLAGAFVIDPERLEDDRGFFARSFCAEEFVREGLDPVCSQCNISYNRRRGTLRGLHFQASPHSEAKLVRCTRGALYDVAVDLRPGSRSLGRHVGVELNDQNRRLLYVPKHFAHGFLTLTDDTEVFYHMSAAYVPGAGRGFRYDDPAFEIDWPIPVTIISDRDQHYPAFDPRDFGLAAD
jgi:dTDP-4-dehydrorhamnose 3,5-epimerase